MREYRDSTVFLLLLDTTFIHKLACENNMKAQSYAF